MYREIAATGKNDKHKRYSLEYIPIKRIDTVKFEKNANGFILVIKVKDGKEKDLAKSIWTDKTIHYEPEARVWFADRPIEVERIQKIYVAFKRLIKYYNK